jgi:hypothetical protein
MGPNRSSQACLLANDGAAETSADRLADQLARAVSDDPTCCVCKDNLLSGNLREMLDLSLNPSQLPFFS